MQGAKYNYNNAVGKVESTTIDASLLRLAVADFEKVKGCGFDLSREDIKSCLLKRMKLVSK